MDEREYTLCRDVAKWWGERFIPIVPTRAPHLASAWINRAWALSSSGPTATTAPREEPAPPSPRKP